MKKEREGFRKHAIWKGSIIAALITSIMLFVIMLEIEKKTLWDYEVGTVYSVLAEIPKGEIITENNYEKYLEEKIIDVSLIPKTAVREWGEIKGLLAAGRIEPGVILTRGMFFQKNEIIGKMEEPVIAGLKAEDLYQIVGGTLRSGDRIHIYQVNEEKEARLIWDDIYVQQVFDNSGKSITNEDETTAAQRINIFLDKAYVETLYSQLADGTLRIVKVCSEK